MRDPFDRPTLRFYAAEAPKYVQRPDVIDPAIAAFLDRLPPAAHILELGCGGGRDAGHMIDRGFIVDPTDGVPEMAAEAQAHLGRPVRVMRFDELDANQRYDAVVANASLLHVPLRTLGGILSRVWRALKPGGWHFAGYKTGKVEGYDEFGRYYNQLTRADAHSLYAASGDWTIIECKDNFGMGYFSKPTQWLTVIAQRGPAA